MYTASKHSKKVYVYKSGGAMCAAVDVLKDGTANCFIAAQGKTYTGLKPIEAFNMAKTRKRLES